jgi:hypothetical protein
MANVSGNFPRILLGPTDSDPQIEQLAQSLEGEGCVVQTFSSMPVEVSLNKFDMAVLVVAATDSASGGATDQRIQRILHAAGFLEARLAPGQVCLLVEDSVEQLAAMAVTQIRYPTGQPMASRNELISFLSQQYPNVKRNLHEHIPIREQVQSSDLRLGWAMLAAVLLIALIPLMLVLRSLGGDDGDLEQMAGVAQALNSNGPAGPAFNTGSALGSAAAESNGASDSGTQLGEEARAEGQDQGTIELAPTTPTTAAVADPDPGATPSPEGDAANDGATQPTLTPQSGGASDDAGSQTLPAVCQVNVRKNLSLPGTVGCEGAGRLVIEGWFGPWHNEISAVALSTGTTGTLYYERAPANGGTELPLTVGTTELDPAAARYGVNDIVVTFGGDGQHVHFFQSQAYGGRVATLTFTLDRP